MKDQELADRGYYEGLLNRGNLASTVWEPGIAAPADRVVMGDAGLTDQTNDLLLTELKVSFAGTFKRVPFTTNRWRIRDKNCEQAKPPGAYRIALVGASHDMGSGVTHDEAYESVLEALLNKKRQDGAYSYFEILNFSVDGYSMVQKAIIMETKLTPFDPDFVIVSVYSTEYISQLNHIKHAVETNAPILDPELQDIVERAWVRPWMGWGWIAERLRPYVYDIIAWSFRKLKIMSGIGTYETE